MERRANYTIKTDNADRLVLLDIGPHSSFLTITNDAENVVADLAPMLKGRRLFYYDSEGQLDELLVKDGRFAGFAPGPPARQEPLARPPVRKA